jgi:hypothetical protein
MLYIFLSLIILIPVAIVLRYLFKEIKNFITYSPTVEEFGRFPFTDEEWAYLFHKEFIEDEKGKSFFDKHFNVVSYGNSLIENAQREIFFTSKEILITSGKESKTFTVNSLNYVGNGFKLSSIDLLHLSPLKKLRIKIDVIGVSSDSSELDYSTEYLVPIPKASLEKIEDIVKAYGKIILES